MPMNKTYISIPQAAQILGVHRQAVFNMVKKGKLAATRIGRKYAIAKKDLEDLHVHRCASSRVEQIKRGVKKVVSEYGEALKMLGED